MSREILFRKRRVYDERSVDQGYFGDAQIFFLLCGDLFLFSDLIGTREDGHVCQFHFVGPVSPHASYCIFQMCIRDSQDSERHLSRIKQEKAQQAVKFTARCVFIGRKDCNKRTKVLFSLGIALIFPNGYDIIIKYQSCMK